MKTVIPIFLLLCFLEIPRMKGAALQEARVSQVIQDVHVLASNAAPRPAVVNDRIGEGNAVKTGAKSRAELTFGDLTITRLGENTIFSLDQSAREVHIEHGSILVEVPPKSASVKMTSALVTAAIQGGTAIFGAGPPAKFLVLEGTGTSFPTGHPELAITLHGGEMVMGALDGHLSKPQQFNVKAVVETSGLIVGFPDLKNLPLILDVIDLQIVPPAPSPPPAQDTISTISTAVNSNPILAPPPAPSATPIEFGPPPTITSPDPFLISSGTIITTDPEITSGGVTDFGTIYRGSAIDGPASAWAFGSTSAFDTESGFDSHINGSGAAFKFNSLVLTGDPTVLTAGGQTALGLIAVNGITSAAPGGLLTFAGINDLLLATQNGSITLGPEISFNLPHSFEAYARGTGSNLTLGSAVTTGGNIRLTAEGSIQVNGALNTGNFHSFAGTDFLAGTGPVTATSSIDVHADHDVTFNLSQFPEGVNVGQSVSVDAGHDVNINATGDQSVFSHASTISVTAANALNITGSNPTTLNLNVSSPALFSAGVGGIQASTVAFSTTGGLDLQSGGDINVFAADIPFSSGGRTIDGSINAAGAVTSTGNITTGDVTAGTSITVGGIGAGGLALVNAPAGGADLFVNNATAGTTINVAGQLFASGAVTTGGNITAGILRVAGSVIAGGNINVGDLESTNVLTPGAINVTDQILPFTDPANGSLSSSIVHTITASSITAGAGINFNGIAAGALNAPTDGSQLTMFAASLSFGPGENIQGPVTLNGGDGLAIGGSLIPAASGGILEIDTAGNIKIDSSIEATTGLEPSGVSYSGNGGSVSLRSAGGSVTISDRIQVSSADPLQDANGAPVPGVRSANGGNIYIESDKSGSPRNGPATAIATTSSSQLLALLGTSGAGGTITMLAPGSNSAVNVEGNIEATAGTIDIEDTGSNSQINLNGGNDRLTNAITMRSDIIKVGVLGSNGTLNIGAGLLSADTLLELYAPGSNGTINFVANVTLGGNAAKIIAADTINIFNGVVVMIAGSTPVSLFANNLHFTGPGADGTTTGMIAGAGYTTQPLSQAPPFVSGSGSSSGATSAVAAQNSGTGGVTSSNSSVLHKGKVAKSGATTKISSPSTVTSAGPVRDSGSEDVILPKSSTSRSREVRLSSASINIGNSGELLSLLDTAKPGANGQITISDPKKTNDSGGSGAGNLRGRSKNAPAAVNREAARDRKPMPSQGNPARSFARSSGT